MEWDGHEFLQRVAAGAAALERQVPEINRLNVYPVPDGDTGTNLAHTLRGALSHALAAPDANAGAAAAALARGALLAARGNSGVIFSQILAGYASAAKGASVLDGPSLAHALTEGAAMARRALAVPVEGTILTGADRAADAAAKEASAGGDALAVWQAASKAAEAAVLETPLLLAVLAEAGVVDAGAAGLAAWMTGAAAADVVAGDDGTPAADVGHVAAEGEGATASMASADRPRVADMPYGYCTEFIVEGESIDLATLRAGLAEISDSLIVAGGPDLVRVHVHTFRPGAALELACAAGVLTEVKIENMSAQHHVADLPAMPVATVATAMVAVAPGPGIGEVFAALGCTVCAGGPSSNPSAEEILGALQSTNAAHVLVLPNHSNVQLAARQAGALFGRPVRVVPTTSVPQGLAAAIAFNPEVDLEDNARSMAAAAQEVITVEIAQAVRDAAVDGHQVRAGSFMGMVDGTVAAIGPTATEAGCGALLAVSADIDVATVIVGEMASESERSDLVDGITGCLKERWPELAVDVVAGEQPHYPLVIGLE